MTQTETLWQIGQPGRAGKEFVQAGGWQAEFTYTVGTDADPIGAPTMPPLLVVPSRKAKPKRGKKQLFATNKLNICFTLARDYAPQELTLFYDFFGSETDTLTLDKKPLAEISGVGEGKLKRNQIPLTALAAGEHTLTLTTAGGAGDGAHWIDYFKLDGVVAPTPVPQSTKTMPAKKQTPQAQPAAQPTPDAEASKSYLPTTQTGLQDYSYWWAYARENAKTTKPNAKNFRRGRIWA
ncbi:MAG: cyanobactin biosynthesis PatC/TenC/TruC family protein [Cyanobacteriota bacterium]|nr:cyanobactin biosynthesis PatC/TenC/TruC family protein [Cyanobacteriota bacterium]